MKLKIQAVAEKVILLLFIIFIFFTIKLFIKDRPIMEDIPAEHLIVAWYIFLFSAVMLSGIALLFINKVLSYLEQRYIFYRSKGIFILIFLMTIIPRAIWLYLVHVIPINDYHAYHIIASELSRGNIIRNDYIALFPHVIGYSKVLSVFYWLFGSKVIVAQLLNIFLDCGIVSMLYLIGKHMFNRNSGILAALIWSLWPSQIFYVSLVSTEAMYSFLNLISIFFLFKVISKCKNLKTAPVLFGATGVLCAVTNAIRPIGLIMLFAAAVFLFFFAKHNNKFGYLKLGNYSAFVIAYFIFFNLINSNISDMIGIQAAKSPVGFNFYVGSNSKYKGVWNIEDSNVLGELSSDVGISSQDIHDILFKEALKRYESQKSEVINLLVNKHKIIWLLDNDILWYIWTALDKSNPSLINYSKHYWNLGIISNLYYYIVLVLNLITGIRLLKKCSNKEILLPVIIVLSLVFVHMLVEVSGRYHYPAISLFSLIAAYGLTIEKKKSYLQK